MGNSESKICSKNINLEIIPKFDNKKDKELFENIFNEKVFKKYFLEIIKKSFDQLNCTSIIENITVNNNINVEINIKYDCKDKIITDDMIYFSIMHRIREIDSLEIEKSIFINFQESDIINLIIQ